MARPLTKISDAKAIAERIGADAVAVIAFKDGQVHAASYGATKVKCQHTGVWLDKIVDGMVDGKMPVPYLDE